MRKVQLIAFRTEGKHVHAADGIIGKAIRDDETRLWHPRWRNIRAGGQTIRILSAKQAEARVYDALPGEVEGVGCFGEGSAFMNMATKLPVVVPAADAVIVLRREDGLTPEFVTFFVQPVKLLDEPCDK